VSAVGVRRWGGALRRAAAAALACGALALPAPALARGQREGPARVQVATMPDGARLAVSSRPGAPRSSLRYVVRSGAREDPPGRAGLAHLLEHVLFHGSRGVAGDDFAQAVRAAGGYVNAFTSATTTVYVLDAPSDAFLPLADRYLRMLTDPALLAARLKPEKGVVDSEGIVARAEPGLQELLESSLFAGAGAVSVLGTTATREAITHEDLEAFFAREYVTSNTALVLTGRVTWEDGVRLARESVLVPPSLPEEAPQEGTSELLLPIEQQSAAPFSLTVLGYALAREDRAHCHSTAALLELRLMLALHVRTPLSSRMAVQCALFRGEAFLLASIYTSSFSADASTLTDRVRGSFRALASAAPSPRELGLLRRRFRMQQAELAEHEALRADALARALGESPGLREARGALDLPAAPTGQQLRALAGRNFTDAREVSITFTPFNVP
jgi:hypothetical protein